MRWIVERTNSWHNTHKEPVWCTERRVRVVDFRVAFSDVTIVIGRLIRKAWSLYRWESRPRHDLLAEAQGRPGAAPSSTPASPVFTFGFLPSISSAALIALTRAIAVATSITTR